MKKIFYILSICVMTILQPSCDALDLAPEDYYGAGNFWKEASQPKAFMLGLHAQLRSYYDMFTPWANSAAAHNVWAPPR